MELEYKTMNKEKKVAEKNEIRDNKRGAGVVVIGGLRNDFL